MFVRIYGSQVKAFSQSWFSAWFSSFVKSIPQLNDCRLTPSMIRPSVIVKAVLEGNGGAQAGQAVAQHALNQTRAYQNRLPVVLLRNAHIRGFQFHVETVVLDLASDGGPLLLIGASELSDRVKQLVPTGLASLSRAARGNQQFEMKEHLEVPLTAEVALTLQLWKEGLLRAQPEWERDRTERWKKVWLPFLCLISVVEDQCVTGALIDTWSDAAERIEQLTLKPEFKLPCPW